MFRLLAGMVMAAKGRPSKFTQAIADEICEQLTEGKSLNGICSAENMPSKSMVCRWLAKHPAFRDQYAHAREAQMESMAEEILEIADETSLDTKIIKRGDSEVEVADTEWINRSRLRVDTRKWLMSKLAPKKYGDKLTHAGDQDNPIVVKRVVTDL